MARYWLHVLIFSFFFGAVGAEQFQHHGNTETLSQGDTISTAKEKSETLQEQKSSCADDQDSCFIHAPKDSKGPTPEKYTSSHSDQDAAGTQETHASAKKSATEVDSLDGERKPDKMDGHVVEAELLKEEAEQYSKYLEMTSNLLKRSMEGLGEMFDQMEQSGSKVLHSLDGVIDQVAFSKDRVLRRMDKLLDKMSHSFSDSRERMKHGFDSVMETVSSAMSESRERMTESLHSVMETMSASRTKIMAEIDHVIDEVSHSKMIEDIKALPQELRESFVLSVRNRSYVAAGVMMAVTTFILVAGALYFAWCHHHDGWSYHIDPLDHLKDLSTSNESTVSSPDEASIPKESNGSSSLDDGKSRESGGAFLLNKRLFSASCMTSGNGSSVLSVAEDALRDGSPRNLRKRFPHSAQNNANGDNGDSQNHSDVVASKSSTLNETSYGDGDSNTMKPRDDNVEDFEDLKLVNACLENHKVSEKTKEKDYEGSVDRQREEDQVGFSRQKESNDINPSSQAECSPLQVAKVSVEDHLDGRIKGSISEKIDDMAGDVVGGSADADFAEVKSNDENATQQPSIADAGYSAAPLSENDEAKNVSQHEKLAEPFPRMSSNDFGSTK